MRRDGAFRRTDWNDSLNSLVMRSPASWDRALNEEVPRALHRFVAAAAAGVGQAGAAQPWSDAQRATLRSHRDSVEADLGRLAENARTVVRDAQRELRREMRDAVPHPTPISCLDGFEIRAL